MSVRERRSYDAEFKKNAVLLCDEESRTVAGVAGVAGVAESLGIPKDHVSDEEDVPGPTNFHERILFVV